jgi:hypothetical protein
VRYTHRAVAERIRDRRAARRKPDYGPSPGARLPAPHSEQLRRIELLLKDLVDLALRADAGTTEALRELEQEDEG